MWSNWTDSLLAAARPVVAEEPAVAAADGSALPLLPWPVPSERARGRAQDRVSCRPGCGWWARNQARDLDGRSRSAYGAWLAESPETPAEEMPAVHGAWPDADLLLVPSSS